MSTCKIILNRKTIEAEKGETILAVARKHGIAVPTLCHHEALTPYGACRLCIVEVSTAGKTEIVSSCNTYVKEGMKITTHSARIKKARRLIVELLLARSPNAPVIQQLARDMGIAATPFSRSDDLCIMCGLCVRTCSEIVGAHAINFAHSGINKEVSVPFSRDSRECIGCGSCVFVCPTGAVRMIDTIGGEQDVSERFLDKWQTRLDLQECAKDGNPFATKRMIEYFSQRFPVGKHFADMSPHCRHNSDETG